MEKLILYTGVNCPKCGRVRRLLRAFATSHNLKEGVDFVEKLVDGENIPTGKTTIDGIEMNIVSDEKHINADVGENFAVANQEVFIEALQHQIASVPAIYYKEKVIFGDDITLSALQQWLS